MAWLDKLERRLGFLAVPGLMRIVVGLTALVFMLVRLNPDFRFVLDLDPARVLHGEVWRLVTYFFYPAGENQMARLGFSRVFVVRVFHEFEFLSHGPGGGVHELSDLFWS